MCSAPGRCGRCSRWAQVASPGQPRCPPPPGSPWTLRLCSRSSDCPGALPYLSRLGHQRPPLPQQPPAPPLPCEDPEGPGKAPGLSPLTARSDAGTSSYRPHPSRVSLLPALLGPGPSCRLLFPFSHLGCAPQILHLQEWTSRGQRLPRFNRTDDALPLVRDIVYAAGGGWVSSGC